jgi:hypothetical protein
MKRRAFAMTARASAMNVTHVSVRRARRAIALALTIATSAFTASARQTALTEGHHLTNPAAGVSSIAAALKPGGRLAVIDFAPRPRTTVAPGDPTNRRGHGSPISVAIRYPPLRAPTDPSATVRRKRG